jgi:hypothetical protein
MKRTQTEEAQPLLNDSKRQKGYELVQHSVSCDCHVCVLPNGRPQSVFQLAMVRLNKWKSHGRYTQTQDSKFRHRISLGWSEYLFSSSLVHCTKTYLWDAFYRERFAVACFVLQNTVTSDISLFQDWLGNLIGTEKIRSIYNVALFCPAVRDSDNAALIALLWSTVRNRRDVARLASLPTLQGAISDKFRELASMELKKQ